jgi:hypothetical protein
MDLNDFDTHSLKVKRFEKITETRFGKKISFNKLDVKTAVKLVNKLDETLNKIRNSEGYHDAHKDSRYTETLMIKEGLDDWLHIQLGINHKRKLTEGEIEQAEAVLAAKDFVDRLQKMLEDIGRIINEDLPPLSDVIRDQMGSEQAEAYSSQASAALSDAQTAISQARGELDNGARILSGEEQAMPDMGMGDEMGGELDVDADMGMGDEMGADELDLDAEGGDDFEMTDPEIGGELELGREER